MKVDQYNIVLTDFAPKKEWSFLDVLRDQTGKEWIAKNKQTNHLHGNKWSNLIRIIWYFLFPLYILFSHKKYAKIIAWQQFYGLNVAFFSRLLHLKKVNELYVLTFIYKRKEGLVGSLYHRYMDYIVNSKYVDKFICFSKEEVAYYNAIFNVTKKEKFVFIPLGLKFTWRGEIRDDEYIFTTGRSNRDYCFLINVLKETSYKTIIVCDTLSANGVMNNVRIYDQCYGDEMLKRMASSHVVVIPLKSVDISSGQLVALQAMALGKPIICTKSNGLADYVIHEKTGLIVNNTKEEWMVALERIYTDKKFYKELSRNARAIFLQKFTEEEMYKNIALIVK